MTKYIVHCLAFLINLAIGFPAYAEGSSEPAGLVTSYELKDADRDGGAVVLRENEKLPLKLWMPLFAGDIVSISSPDSRVAVDIASGERVELNGAVQRVTIERSDSSDDSWREFVTQIAKIFVAVEEESAPTNFFSKGYELPDKSLEVRMALHTPNYILFDDRPVWVAWRGGQGPYTLVLDIDGVRRVIGTQSEAEVEIVIPGSAKNRFALMIEDSLGKRVRVPFQIHKNAPEMPRELQHQAARLGAEQAIRAGWLAAQDSGAWRIEAARILHAMPRGDRVAARLLLALANGWPMHD